MFKQRLLTGLILAPLVIWFLLKAGFILFSSVVVLLTLLLGWEWARLIPLENKLYAALFLLSLLIAMVFLHFAGPFLLLPLTLFWLPFLMMIPWFPVSQNIWGHQMIVGLLGLLFLPLFALALITLLKHPLGHSLLVYLALLVWAADIGAYSFGKLCGKHRLIPKVSPNKTWEGVMGGLLGVLIVAFIGEKYFLPVHVVSWYILAFGIMIVSLAGDLFISMLKRRVQIKDTGGLLPGHGGVLDRLDSLLTAAPLFCMTLQWGLI